MTHQSDRLEPPPPPKMGLEPKVTAGSSNKVAEPKKEAKVWNTKNLDLRLGSDLLSGICVATAVSPIITIIDK